MFSTKLKGGKIYYKFMLFARFLLDCVKNKNLNNMYIFFKHILWSEKLWKRFSCVVAINVYTKSTHNIM